MNLSYSILWVDDDESFNDSQSHMLDQLREYIASDGFDLFIQFETSPDKVNLNEINNAFDLMVIDYNLTHDGQNGDDLIKSIRDHDCLTEVIFYTAGSSNNLRQFAADKELEGIFFSSKDADALRGKVESVFALTVRKVLDVDNMRGLVMAGVADIDHQLTDLLKVIHEKLEENERLDHRKKILGKMLPVARDVKKLFTDSAHDAFEGLSKAISALNDLDPQTFDILIGHRGFDSHKRAEAVESFCLRVTELAQFKDNIASIKASLKWRNALAHQQPKIIDDVHYFQPERDKDEAFDENRRKDLRKSMRELRLRLTEAKQVAQTLGTVSIA